jgi:ribosomal protein S18 acetylase RimI-like enzyme
MHTRVLKPRNGPALLVRPLRHGDVATVRAVFGRLGERSRRTRFNGPKPCLSAADLEQLATVDPCHHALVAYVEGDPEPVAIAQLARTGDSSAEIAFAVADAYQQRGIGSALASELLVDARAAGITQITALASSDNPAALALLRRTTNVTDIRLEGPELSIRAAIA